MKPLMSKIVRVELTFNASAIELIPALPIPLAKKRIKKCFINNNIKSSFQKDPIWKELN